MFPFTDKIKRKPFHYTVWSSRNRRGVSRNRTITLQGDKKEEEEKMIRSFKPISHLKLCRKTIFSVTSCDNFPRFRNAPFFRPFHIVVLFHNVFFPSSLHDVCSCHGIISPAVYSAFRIQKRIQSGVETGQELSSTARNEGKSWEVRRVPSGRTVRSLDSLLMDTIYYFQLSNRPIRLSSVPSSPFFPSVNLLWMMNRVVRTRNSE